jgi:hypothetical protein
MSTNKNMKHIWAAVNYTDSDKEKKTFWTKIGVAFENKDGSSNLVFDLFPTSLATTTIQIRDIPANER